MAESLYLIDAYSLIFQVYHAIQQEMTSRSGLPTNAIYGVTRDVHTLLRTRRPDYLIAAYDSPEQAVRNDWFPAYKANRAEMPDNLRPQIPLIRELLEAFGVPVLEHAGWEADDVIATLVKQALARDLDVVIVTTDKDARQLIGPRVRLFNARKLTFLGADELLADWGIAPHQVVDFQSLVGDSVDNVPGIPLVGPKKASALLQQFGDLETVLANADKAPGAKLKENLKIHADVARASRRLVKLYDDLPIDVDWDRARAGQLDRDRLQAMFTEFGFRRLADEVLAPDPAAPPAAAPPPKPRSAVARTLFGDEDEAEGEAGDVSELPSDVGETAAASSANLTRTFEIIDTSEKLAEFERLLAAQTKICLDLETTGLDAVRADIVGWAFSWQRGAGYYIPVQGPPGQAVLNPAVVVARLRPLLERPELTVVNQNIKYDLLVLRRAGIQIPTLGLDPMVGDYLLEAGARSHGLDDLAKRYLRHTMIPISALIGTGKNQKSMTEVDVQQVAEYAVEDAEIAWQLADVLEDKLRQLGLWDLYWNLERPLIPVLAEMEHHGIRVEAPRLAEQSEEAAAQLAVIEQEIYALAGREFNIDSPIQLRQILFTDLALPVKKKTKTGPSTDQDVLEALAELHPLPAKLIAHRRLSKLKSTYLDALPTMINPETGRIHASFNQVVAATGRLSSSDPNLQNIPIRTPEGQRVRAAFTAGEPGWVLLSADYSQIELRMLAHFSHDAALQQAFAEGVDIHTSVAADIYAVPLDAVTSEMRRVAKAVNFGVIYGQSPFGLAQALGIPKGQAAKFIDDYFQKYAGVTQFLDGLLKDCLQRGFVETILGRRRRIDGVRTWRPRGQLNLPERTAVNTVIQGSAADLIKQAMIRIHQQLHAVEHPARLLLQIHDELVFETPPDRVADLAELVTREMEHALPLDVPIRIDLGIGPDWLHLSGLDEATLSPLTSP